MTLRSVIPALLAAAVVGCSGSPTQPSWDGRVRVAGTVRDFPTSVAASAATVVFGTGGASDVSAATDASGAYALTVLPGMYHVTINGESIADVAPRDPTYRGDFFIRVSTCRGRYGVILDSRTRQPVSGATVSIGSPSQPPWATTDQTGWYQWSLGCGESCGLVSTFSIGVTHPGYVQKIIDGGRSFCDVHRIDVGLDPN